MRHLRAVSLQGSLAALIVLGSPQQSAHAGRKPARPAASSPAKSPRAPAVSSAPAEVAPGPVPVPAAAATPVAAPVAAPEGAPAAGPAIAAREAYNAGNYVEAAKGFLAAVQASPREAELYRALARARVWNKDHAGAVIAYRFYLQLASETPATERAKIEAELDNALKQLATPPPEGPPAAGARVMAEARKRAGAGDVAGGLEKAAEALAKGYFAPDLSETQAELVAPLSALWAAQLAAFAAVEQRLDAPAVERVRQGFSGLARLRPLNPAEAAAAGGAAGLLALQAGRDAEAVDSLVPHAASDARLRVALAVALLRLGRADEAASGLASLNSDDRQVLFLLGLCRAAAGQDPTAALRRALDL